MLTSVGRVGRFCVLTSLLVLVIVTSYGVCDVFTSSNKIIELAASEGSLLDALNNYIRDQYDGLKVLSQFLSERSKAFHLDLDRDLRQEAEHPNGAYFLIKHFNRQWHSLTKTHPGLATQLNKMKVDLPADSDYQGSLSSLIRLQRVYRLSPRDMYIGNYSNYLGPPLEPEDAFLLGRQAFIDGFLAEAVSWLQLAVEGMMKPRTHQSVTHGLSLSRGASLLGRAYLFMGNKTLAKDMYNLSKELEPNGGDVLQLQKELDGEVSTYGHNNKTWHHNMTLLCTRPKEQRVAKTQPWHVCRCRAGWGLPYLPYKEEILSLAPFVSVFYNVAHDGEIETIKEFVKDKMFRGMVGQGKEATVAGIRTSNLGWMHDKDVAVANTVSQRVKAITGLEVDQRHPTGPSSAEAMQVVNYGLGGHYDAHMDPFHSEPTHDHLLRGSGDRIATFLIYLSDVEKGGSTVFLNSAISVSPVKGMALFWYNFAPAMADMDQMTRHAGCPVLIGQKWIANKWIWTHGNTFRRPCGPTPDSTQMDIETILAQK